MDKIEKLAEECWEQVNGELFHCGGVNPTAFVLGFKYGYKVNGQGLADWLLYGNTGASSLDIVKFMQTTKGCHLNHYFNHPYDSGDFGRCFGLLKAVPEFRMRLDEMSVVSSEWSNLVRNWKELEQLHLADPKDTNNVLTKRIQEILDHGK